MVFDNDGEKPYEFIWLLRLQHIFSGHQAYSRGLAFALLDAGGEGQASAETLRSFARRRPLGASSLGGSVAASVAICRGRLRS